MNKTKITIWGRDFELDVYMECYPGEIVLDSQKSALEALLNATDAIENAKTQVEEYVMTNNKESFPDGKLDNIFRYVMPVKVFVPHDKEHGLAAILCNYRFDMEHGLAVLFENGTYKSVGSQDTVL